MSTTNEELVMRLEFITGGGGRGHSVTDLTSELLFSSPLNTMIYEKISMKSQ